MSARATAIGCVAPRAQARPTVLVVESETAVGGALVEQLSADGYRAELARTGEQARALGGRVRPCAVVVGGLGNRLGALQLVREIRDAESPTAAIWPVGLPIIMLGAQVGELDMLRAFDAGVDDFIARPLRYLELRARLRALLRRAERAARASSPPQIAIGPLQIDMDCHSASLYGARLDLRRLEFELLIHLAGDPTRVFAKHELLAAVWGYRSTGSTRTVDSHASRLRRKLEQRERGEGRWVINVWGVGYRLR
jgi:DNA-binding response OmpR family regulator